MEDKQYDMEQIASFDNYLLANMSKGLLEENGVFCYLKDEYIVTIDPLLNPAVGGIKLMVRTHDAENARNLIKQAEADYIATIPCPRCKSNSLDIQEKINIPDSFWGKLWNKIAVGQTATYSKKYLCKQCGASYNEVPVNVN